MFVQVIEGHVVDVERLRTQLERWKEELMPAAEGFLGGSAGVTDDGTYVAMARFVSEEAARVNSQRLEQDAWWKETAGCFEGDVSFRDTTDVDLLGGGGSDDAGFVQVVQGSATEPQRLKALSNQIMPELRQHRPDILGSVRAWHHNGEFTQFAYFTSETEARAGEAKELPAELQHRRNEAFGLMENLQFLDLRETWLITP